MYTYIYIYIHMHRYDSYVLHLVVWWNHFTLSPKSVNNLVRSRIPMDWNLVFSDESCCDWVTFSSSISPATQYGTQLQPTYAWCMIYNWRAPIRRPSEWLAGALPGKDMLTTTCELSLPSESSNISLLSSRWKWQARSMMHRSFVRPGFSWDTRNTG